ncbi:hypothetical protein BH24BAC1_BH24BAC1_04750 [soil metagenome]
MLFRNLYKGMIVALNPTAEELRELLQKELVK